MHLETPACWAWALGTVVAFAPLSARAGAQAGGTAHPCGMPVDTGPTRTVVAEPDPAPPDIVGPGEFSIVLLPDTQCYCEDYDLSPTSPSTGNRYAQRFFDQTAWIVAHLDAYDIRFVSHVGDVVQNFDHGNASEWDVARTALNAFHPLGEPTRCPFVPYSISLGNHDFDEPAAADLSATRFLAEYGPARFENADGEFHAFYAGSDAGWKYVATGHPNETGKGLNSCQRFYAGPYEFLHITLQCAPTNGSLAWAETILAANPGVRTLVSTHAFLSGGNTHGGVAGVLFVASEMGRLVPGKTNDAVAVWQKLIRRYDQIFIVLCGHAWEQELVVMHNDFGHDVLVYEASFTLESHGGKIRVADQQGAQWAYTGADDDDRNGSGWLGLLVFAPKARHVTWYTYSPTLDVWACDRAPQDYPTTMTTYPWGADVIIRTPLDLDDSARFAP
ncbi:MAG: hypothetical protein IT453_15820 [Planctomycetes bacterium]|nr:hypothetical protein [Planctomycetota bacterium]